VEDEDLDSEDEDFFRTSSSDEDNHFYDSDDCYCSEDE